jgi:hypothetical protein
MVFVFRNEGKNLIANDRWIKPIVDFRPDGGEKTKL